ncbi:Acetylxylan esterase [Pontiella desulfatans]|uniref:Acetylxylan esterase n=1 Tax=Pontiella desulfatans TaxID=2750659 RepID=A0A6C2U117_PONDE|nr:alpha/beta hydrolase [Pontiella desulfatans]VGO13509.1 Acetylxylan esterase [Pontiella desulfatans]
MTRWIAGIGVALAMAGTCELQASEFSDKIQASFDAGNPKPTKIFKLRDQVEVHYFAPTQPIESGNNPAFVYIHGGGWRGGNPKGSYRWCRYLAEHGVSVFTIRYQRANEKKGIKPIQCVKDAKTAMRWVRANAKKFGINPDKIAVAGNSAGGHLATALVTIKNYTDAGDDLSVSCRPDLLLLASPVIDNGPGGYGNGHPTTKQADYRVKGFWRDFSPIHNLNKNLPDSFVIMGDEDPLIRVVSVELFGQAVAESSSEFEWWVFPGKGHGLFSSKESYLTPELMHIFYRWHVFLAKHEYLPAPLSAGDEVQTLVEKKN